MNYPTIIISSTSTRFKKIFIFTFYIFVAVVLKANISSARLIGNPV